ncbi:MAG TPA: DUF4192 family protein, partial [Pseudonocardiaceae bacterium]
MPLSCPHQSALSTDSRDGRIRLAEKGKLPRMTTTPPTDTGIRITESADLLAAVPHLLGFHPVDSLVVIGLHGQEPM